MTLNEAIKHARDTAENRTDLCDECRAEHEQLAEWLEELKRLKEADAVEVVRCRECKWWEYRLDRYGIGKCQNPLNGLFSEYSDDEDFCSYGRRKDDGT